VKTATALAVVRAPIYSHALRSPGDRSRRHLESEESPEVLTGEVTIPKDLRKEARTEGFTRMNGHHGRTAVGMPQIVVAPFDPDHLKTGPLESSYYLSPAKRRELRHPATVIF